MAVYNLLVLGYDISAESFFPTVTAEQVHHQVPSSSSPSLKYDVNLVECTCTCPDFRERRALLPKRDPNRACKHIRRALDSIHPGFFVQTIEFQCGEQTIRVERDICKNWVDVYANKRSGARPRRFGYSLVEKRWSYGDAPKGSQEIAQQINHTFLPCPETYQPWREKQATKPQGFWKSFISFLFGGTSCVGL